MSEDLFSVLAAIGIIALVYRWFTTAPSTTLAGQAGSRTQTALQHRALAVPQSQVDRLLTTFPQLTENEIRYALVTTPGGLEAVAERVLSHGGLTPVSVFFFSSFFLEGLSMLFIFSIYLFSNLRCYTLSADRKWALITYASIHVAPS